MGVTVLSKDFVPGKFGCETSTTIIVDAITGKPSSVPPDAITASLVIGSDGRTHISVHDPEGAFSIPNASTSSELAAVAKRLGITPPIVLY